MIHLFLVKIVDQSYPIWLVWEFGGVSMEEINRQINSAKDSVMITVGKNLELEAIMLRFDAMGVARLEHS